MCFNQQAMGITKPEIISREIIKPSSPTPHSQKIYNLSLLDQQIARGLYVSIIFFYQNKEGKNNSAISNELKKSLSETLTHYYPLAGRIKDGATIDCNDEGVYFSEARVDSHLEEFLKHHQLQDLETFMQNEGSKTRSLLIIQVTFFSCGGIAIGVSISHDVADIKGISAFINDWAKMSAPKLAGNGISISAELTRFFPPTDSVSSIPKPEPKSVPRKGNFVPKRFIFDSTKIGELKTKATQYGVENPTRVGVVTALIYRRAIVAASKATSGGFLKPSALTQAVNLRKRIIPQLSERSFENMVWVYTIQTDAKESEIEFPALVGQLKAGLSRFCDTYGKNFTGQELIQLLFGGRAKTGSDNNHHVHKYTCSSWCRSSLYEADFFGWGKPTWLTPSGTVSQNVMLLNDTRDGDGIEAFVALEEQEMAIFERDEELLQFSTLH